MVIGQAFRSGFRLMLLVVLFGLLHACGDPVPSVTEQDTPAATGLQGTATSQPATAIATADNRSQTTTPTILPTIPLTSPTRDGEPTVTATKQSTPSPTTAAPTASATLTVNSTATATGHASPPPATSEATTSSPINSTTGNEEEIALLGPQGYATILQGDEQIQIPGARGGSLEWSPDGYRLALGDGVRTFGDDLRQPPLFSPILGSSFRWSPDGRHLAWTTPVGEESLALSYGGPDGDEARVAGANNFMAVGIPAWSPDGQLLAAGPIVTTTDGSSSPSLAVSGLNLAWSPASGTIDGPEGPRIAWPEGGSIAWTEIDDDATTVTVTLMLWDVGEEAQPLARLTFPRAQEAGAIYMLRYDPPRLHWLPDSSAVLLPVPWDGIADKGGTWLVDRNGTATRVSPHVLTDLHGDGERMLARTQAGEIAIVRIEDGSVERTLGPGSLATWRPARRGAPPSAPLAAKSPTLSLTSPRMTGPAVRELQQRLKALGYEVGKVDGVFGPQTEQAVRTFQEQNEPLLEDDSMTALVDGVVGPKTWAVLRSPDPIRPE